MIDSMVWSGIHKGPFAIQGGVTQCLSCGDAWNTAGEAIFIGEDSDACLVAEHLVEAPDAS